MRISTLFISLLSLVVSLCAASPQPLLVRLPPISTASVAKRPVNSEISLQCPVTACCTTTFETQYYNCLYCVGMALNTANFSTAQTSLNLLYMTCVDMGFVLPRMELPGQSNSTSASSGSGGAITPATGSAVGTSWRGGQVDALIGAALLLGVAGLW
ncbi:hypothetical protein OG21DRAFT_678628 [Imleria badia]|nr:hypothetical protein OG21DRAFT_678628 [Imleria badia]